MLRITASDGHLSCVSFSCHLSKPPSLSGLTEISHVDIPLFSYRFKKYFIFSHSPELLCVCTVCPWADYDAVCEQIRWCSACLIP